MQRSFKIILPFNRYINNYGFVCICTSEYNISNNYPTTYYKELLVHMIALVRYKLRTYTYRCDICTPKLWLVFVLFNSLHIFSRTQYSKVSMLGCGSGVVAADYFQLVPSVPICTPCSFFDVGVDTIPDRKKIMKTC